MKLIDIQTQIKIKMHKGEDAAALLNKESDLEDEFETLKKKEDDAYEAFKKVFHANSKTAYGPDDINHVIKKLHEIGKKRLQAMDHLIDHQTITKRSLPADSPEHLAKFLAEEKKLQAIVDSLTTAEEQASKQYIDMVSKQNHTPESAFAAIQHIRDEIKRTNSEIPLLRKQVNSMTDLDAMKPLLDKWKGLEKHLEVLELALDRAYDTYHQIKDPIHPNNMTPGNPYAPINQRYASGPTGLYGFTRKIQSDCESATKRVSKTASRLANQIYAKDPKTAEFLVTHAKRASSLPAKILVSAMKEIGPKIASMESTDMSKTARGEHGLYGFAEKTCGLGLQACTDLRHEAGKVAADLHSRRYDSHEKISSFLTQHAKEARCLHSKLILASYPDANMKYASSMDFPLDGQLVWATEFDEDVTEIRNNPKQAGYSYIPERMYFSFIGNKPYNVDTEREINQLMVSAKTVEGDTEDINLHAGQHEYSGPLTYQQEKLGYTRENIIPVQYPKGSEKEVVKVVSELGKRMGFKVTALKAHQKPQTQQPKK